MTARYFRSAVFYCLLIFWATCQGISSQNVSDKDALLSVVTEMKKDLAEIAKSIDMMPHLNVSDYFQERVKWQLLPAKLFRAQLLECAVNLGYLAFEPLFYDQIAASLPEQVFYASFNTQFVSDSFSTYERNCKIWKKNKLAEIAHNCDIEIPAICLTVARISRSEASMHNEARQIFPDEIMSFHVVLDTASGLLTQGVPPKMLFEEDFFGATLVQSGETLRGSKVLIASQVELMPPSTLLRFQTLRFQVLTLIQRALVSSLQSWTDLQAAVTKLPSDTQSALNDTKRYLQELEEVRQELTVVKSTLESGSGLSEDCPPTLQNVTNPFCDSFFENCVAELFPLKKSVSIKKLIKYSFVNFYLGLSWALLMFVILVVSAIYTYRQHLKVKKLSDHIIGQPQPTRMNREQEPLIDMAKLGRALNHSSQQ